MEGVPGGVTSSSMLELDAKHLILAAVGERWVVTASAMTAAWVRGGATRRRRGETERRNNSREGGSAQKGRGTDDESPRGRTRGVTILAREQGGSRGGGSLAHGETSPPPAVGASVCYMPCA